jgi:diguanylate cyclase (GGDEF)-like protein
MSGRGQRIMNKLLILFRRITDVRVEVKIIGIAVGISLFALLVGVLGLMDMAKINHMSTQIYQKELLCVSHIKEAYVNLICFSRAEKNIMLAFTKEDKLHHIKTQNTNKALYLSNIKAAASLLETEQEKAVLSRLECAWAEYSIVSKQIVDLATMENLNKSRPSIKLTMGPAREKINAVIDPLDELTRIKEEKARRLSEKAAAIYESSRLVLAGIIAGGVILAIALGILLSFVIAGPLKRARSETEAAIETLRESEERYRDLSIVDALTQLYNSRHFYFQLKIELDRSNRYELPLTLLLLDIDDFKRFNDDYGHVKGDEVLMRIGQVIKRCLRETDFGYRYGGEEFTILLPMTTSVKGVITAERIRTELKEETFPPASGKDVHVTMSTGLRQYKPQEDMKAFVHRVDQLMYQAKKNGKDRVCCES